MYRIIASNGVPLTISDDAKFINNWGEVDSLTQENIADYVHNVQGVFVLKPQNTDAKKEIIIPLKIKSRHRLVRHW